MEMSRMKDWDAELPAARNSCYSTSVIVRSTIALMTAGNSNYADIEKFRSDFLFRKVAGGNVPSQETYRQRLNALAEKDWQRILDANVSDQLSRVSLTRIDVDGETLIPLDIDVSVFEDTASHKEGVSLSYHKVNGLPRFSAMRDARVSWSPTNCAPEASTARKARWSFSSDASPS
jgi:hypothetical protein